MPKTVFALHTNFSLVEPLGRLFVELLPGMRIVNLVDDSLLADVRAAGGPTASVIRRMIGYAVLAQSAGADVVFNCCSSVGEAADLLSRSVDIPVVKIDNAMAARAVDCGPRVGVVGTVATTLEPTARLIERKAGQAGKTVAIRRYLVDGAFDALISGNTARHDQMVTAEITQAAAENDVVVLAQGSMARLVASLEGTLSIPVLSSPRAGVEELRQVLTER
jgi:Asp/Glu/hydantoin racemase